MINDVILKVTINFKDLEVKKDRLDSGAKDVKESDIIIGKTHLKAYEDPGFKHLQNIKTV